MAENTWFKQLGPLLAKDGLDKAGIFCKTSGSVWAKTDCFDVTGADIIKIMKSSESDLQSCGCQLEGMKYYFLRQDEGIFAFRKGTNGLIIAETNNAYIAAAYQEPLAGTNAFSEVQKVAAYLTSNGY